MSLLKKTFFIFILSICFLFLANNTDNYLSIEVNLSVNDDDNFSILDNFFKEPVFIEKIDFESDIAIPDSEFFYLTGLKENTNITVSNIKRACWLLKRKNKFDSVLITFDNNSKNKILKLKLNSLWTFSRAKIKGILSGKDKYFQFYQPQACDVFDLEKHQRSIEKISQELKNDGYLKSRIIDTLYYDKKLKQVKVILKIEDADRYNINKITVDLNLGETELSEEQNYLKNKIEKIILGQLDNSYYSKFKINDQIQNIRKYLLQKGFLRPDITYLMSQDDKKSQVSLDFKIKLYQKKSFIFFGNSFFSTKELLNELLTIENSAILIPPHLLAEDIIALYKKKGFWQIRVKWKEEAKKFLFTIKEGPRIKVSKILIKGNSDLNTEELLKKTFTEFYKLTYFDADILKQCIDKLNSEYIQAGYWNFSVTNQEFIKTKDIQKSKDNNIYELVLYIDQGERKIIKSIEIENYPELINYGPFANWGNLKKSELFDIKIIQEQRQWLLKYFHDKGYIYTSVKPELINNQDGLLLKWHVNHNTGQVKFGKTIITGCNNISSKIILRELQYKEGDIWNKEKIDQSIKRLKSLNMFDSVSITPYNLSEPEPEKTLILKIVEDDQFELKARLGFAQVNRSFVHLPTTTYRAGGSFLWKNPCNIADILRADIDLTRFTRNFSLSYEMPWILNQPIHSLFRIYSYQIGQPLVAGSNQRLYTENHDGASLNLRKIVSNIQLYFITNLEFMKISGLCSNLSKIIHFEPRLVDKRIPYLTFEPSLIIDNFDNPLNPTIGSYTLLSLRGVFPLDVKDAYFVKLFFEQSFIYPVYNSIIGALRFRAGHIFNSKFNAIVPTERFYLGGPNSIRSYEPNMAPPLNCFTDQSGEVFWVPIGGRSMFNINAELRFPLYKSLSGVIFNDMGLLSENKFFSQISAKDILGATGFGFRYLTPIGPLRFDIGFKWNKRLPTDKSFTWYLTFGQSF